MAERPRNCIRCGKLFVPMNREKICRNCKDAEREMENTVMEFVRNNPKSKIPEISEGTGAPETLIRRMVEEGRFDRSDMKFYYPCKKCGKDILVGQYCEDCLNSMQENLQSVQEKMASASSSAAKGKGMHSKTLGKQPGKK